MIKNIGFAIMLISLPALASISTYLNKSSPTFISADNRKLENDFFGLVVVTPSNEWEREWETSSDAIPNFKEVEHVSLGQQLSILTFFANPKADSNNNVNVICSLKVTRPNKTISVDEKSISCLSGTLQGTATNIRLSPGILKFVAEKSDPSGLWLVEVTIEDKNRKTTLKMHTQFQFTGEN